MRRTLVSTVLLSTVLVIAPTYLLALDATPAHFWSQRFGAGTADMGEAVTVDGSGNVVVTGTFTGTISFGGSALVSAGGTDVFVARYNAAGVHQWSQRFGSTGADAGLTIAVDASGNVVVGGSFAGTVDFGGGNLVSVGSADMFLARYDASGVHQWSKRLGGTIVETLESVVVDGLGNIIVTGQFSGTVDFGGGGLVASFTDVFLAKYDPSGVHQWSKRFGGTAVGRAVDVDGSNNIVITGLFNGSVDFGGGVLVSASLDVFLAKYNASGVHQWSQKFGGTTNDIGTAVAIDGDNRIIITGSFTGTASFGGGNFVSAGFNDIFVAKYDLSGAHVWSRGMGSASSDEGSALAVSPAGDLVVTGFLQGPGDLGGGTLTPAGSADVFVAKYYLEGSHVWSTLYGGVNGDLGNAVALDSFNNLIVTGYFQSTANFGGGNLISAGGSDIFLAKYGPIPGEPWIVSVLDIGNDQGRQVRVFFARSGHDLSQSPTSVTKYDVYRRIVPLPTAAQTLLPSPPLEQWDHVGSVPAYRAAGYNVVVPTLADSTIADGMHYSYFFVRAGTNDPAIYFDSSPDSGYSVDNLAPGVPQALTFSGGLLNWNDSEATDFDYFTVYGSATNSFASSTVIDYAAVSTLDVSPALYAYYFVTATDFAGNEGEPATIHTSSDVPPMPERYVLSVSAFPNPFNPGTTLKYTVPDAGRITVAIYDAAGAHVLTLVDGDMPAGAYTTTWDGRSDRGNAASSGVYFARISQAGNTRSYKLVLLK